MAALKRVVLGQGRFTSRQSGQAPSTLALDQCPQRLSHQRALLTGSRQGLGLADLSSSRVSVVLVPASRHRNHHHLTMLLVPLPLRKPIPSRDLGRPNHSPSERTHLAVGALDRAM